MIDVADMLGVGLYTPTEAAYLARVPLQRLNRWLFGSGTGERVASPQLDSNEKWVTFQDFIQVLAIRNLRAIYDVPLPKIREGIENAEKEFNVRFPLARRRSVSLFGDQLYISLAGEYHKITGDNRKQKMITPVVELFMEDVSFDAAGVASKYRAFVSEGREIVMDPEVRFGEPIVLSCGYSAQALWEACRTEGGYSQAAAAYGVEKEDVLAAMRYQDHLSLLNAA